jgi:hypothetical protein
VVIIIMKMQTAISSVKMVQALIIELIIMIMIRIQIIGTMIQIRQTNLNKIRIQTSFCQHKKKEIMAIQ